MSQGTLNVLKFISIMLSQNVCANYRSNVYIHLLKNRIEYVKYKQNRV